MVTTRIRKISSVKMDTIKGLQTIVDKQVMALTIFVLKLSPKIKTSHYVMIKFALFPFILQAPKIMVNISGGKQRF